ncbi:Sugar phosphate isomerase/epimerase [Caldanaerobius fijiensis DSM 17918]|uniref:Sugar phosphate isomerase/epimerase n=1 Tax=Caldanaerobius fijiensis DSM 17918 TaxID=1121256 RepID=A0A1M4W0K1_9THEO|nr:TIM barrel protein [Caldanaerobius fijiensis]SHE74665.1 Sugar phosphate isomerase/epimerase [Caldanaerobius fijiensis DSM 17918]
MNESMYKYMKVGIIHFMAFPDTMKGEGPIFETLQKIMEDEFFNAVEISWVKDDSVRDKVKNRLEAAHMAVAYGAQPRLLTTGLDLNSFDEDIRQKAVETIKEGVDEAYYFGAQGIAFLSGKYPGEENKQKAMDLLRESIEEICDYAKSKGDMLVELEVFDRDIEKKSLIGPTPDAVKIAEMIKKKYDNFGLVVDLSHLPLLKETPEQALIPVKDHLTHAHIGNCVVKDKNHVAYGDAHPRFGIKGGENDVPQLVQFLKVLFDIGFLNDKKPPIVSFEVKPLPNESPEVVIANAKRTLLEAWARL